MANPAYGLLNREKITKRGNLPTTLPRCWYGGKKLRQKKALDENKKKTKKYRLVSRARLHHASIISLRTTRYLPCAIGAHFPALAEWMFRMFPCAVRFSFENHNIPILVVGGGNELVCDLMTASVWIGSRWSNDYGKDECYPRYCSTSSSQPC